MKKTVILLAATLISAGASAACYTVMDAKGKILSESPNPPVDMSKQLHQTVPLRFGPGASMVFGIADNRCGNEVDRYYDLQPTAVVYRDGGARSRMRARRADRQ